MIRSVLGACVPTPLKPVLAHALGDVLGLINAAKSYGDSWKNRGGVGAFMMLARKWDRIEKQVSEKDWDVFEAIIDDIREEGIIDDIRDLRRYLLLVESEMVPICTDPESIDPVGGAFIRLMEGKQFLEVMGMAQDMTKYEAEGFINLYRQLKEENNGT